MNPKGWSIPVASLSQFALSAILILGVYFHVIQRLVYHEWKRADFDYCYLIPLVIVYLIWEDRKKLMAMPSRPSWIGLVSIICGAVFFFLGELGGEFLSLYLSLWFMILGLCWIQFGWQKLKIVLFPVSLMLTAFPPPHFFYAKLTMDMQLISSQIGEKVLHALGVSAYRTGNLIDLGFTRMQVVDACSGLRFLIPMLIMALLLVYLYKYRWWKRLLVLISAIPLAVVLNGVRIGIIGYMAKAIDPSIMSGAIHDTTGWVMFFAGTGAMFAMLQCLGKLGDENKVRHKAESPVEIFSGKPPGFPAPFVLALVLIVGAYGFLEFKAQSTPFLPMARSLDEFPERLGHWSGRSYRMSQDLINELDFSDYVQMTYEGPTGAAIDFYVAWYASQSKGESIHSPETCLRGGGWQFISGGAAEVEINGYERSPLRVNRTVLKQGETEMLSYFWFPVRGQNLVNAYELKLATFWGGLTQNRSDGALVRVTTVIRPGEGLGDSEARLQDFLSLALPVLDTFFPE
jgi:exosortase D (VPLPA-CTERM-specific)